jgi:hypothetical protein
LDPFYQEHKKKHLDPHAKVCPALSNHEIFEKWRVKDTTKLGLLELEEYEEDKRESSRRYYSAWYNTAARTTHSSFRAFWMPFGIKWYPGMLPADDMDGEGDTELGFEGRESAFDMGMSMRESGLDEIYKESTIDNKFSVHNPMAGSKSPPANVDDQRWRSATTGATVHVPAYKLEKSIVHETTVDVSTGLVLAASECARHESTSGANQSEAGIAHEARADVRPRLSTLDAGFFEHHDAGATHDEHPSAGPAHDHDLHSWHRSGTGSKVEVNVHHGPSAGIGHRAAEALHRAEHAAVEVIHKTEQEAAKALHKVGNHRHKHKQ